MKLAAIVIALALLLSSGSYADSLEKRHQIGLRIGVWNQTADVRSEIDAEGVTTSVEANGFLGGVYYGHWIEEYLAVTIDIGGMAADVSTSVDASGVTTETSIIGSILLGLKAYFPKSTYASSVRPYARAGVGPISGSQSSTSVGESVTIESRSETAFGGQIGAGVDFILGRHFMTGLAGCYNLMTDFNQPIGGSKNYSGPELSVGFCYLFGRGAN